MWSVKTTGRRGVLKGQQRVLVPIVDGSDATRRIVMSTLRRGQCFGLALLNTSDPATLRIARTALETAHNGDEPLSRAQVAIVATTPAACASSDLTAHLENVLVALRTSHIDVLLLDAATLPPTQSLSVRKQVLLELWEQMVQLRDTDITLCIGVSDLSIQDVELISSSFPNSLPSLLSVEAAIHHNDDSNTSTPSLSSLVSFAHGRGLDVLVRFPLAALDDLPLRQRDQWKQTAKVIAQRHAAASFKHLVANEVETNGTFHVESISTKTNDSENPFECSALIVLRFLLQRGLAVVPFASNAEDDDRVRSIDEIISAALHPFASMDAAYSPHHIYSSILSDDELDAVGHTLQLVIKSDSTPRS